MLEEELNEITLSPGDVIIDLDGRAIGLLVKCERRIDIVEDDIYFWHIKWSNDTIDMSSNSFPYSEYIEEDRLKTLIILDIIRWQSVKGDND